MPHDADSTGTPREWLRRARGDLALARLPKLDDILWEDLCFHIEQAVEKALKAAVIHILKELPPRTHNLAELSDMVEAPRRIRTFLMELTPEYVTTRYPDAAGGPIESLYNGSISRRILGGTEEVLDWLRGTLKK